MINTSTQFPSLPTVSYLSFFVNEKQIVEHHVEPDWTLLWYLRNKLGLTGSKLSCGEGGCGACTVLISQRVDSNSSQIEHRTINACLTPVCSIDGCHVVTVEGLGSVSKSNLHPIQSRLAEMFGSQCGFCTPGMVMSLYGTITSINNQSSLTIQDIEEALDGNLCRCTGYRPILDTAKSFAEDIHKQSHRDASPLETTSTTFDKCVAFAKHNGSATAQVDFPQQLYHHVAQSIHIQELQQLRRTPTSLMIGSGVTFTRLKSKLIEWNDADIDGGVCQALIDQLRYFATPQVRNVASLGGSIVNASPMSDINPVLQAVDASLELQGANGNLVRDVSIRDFFIGHHRVAMNDDEVLVAIHIPLRKPLCKSFIRAYKQARRRCADHAVVTAGLQVEVELSDSESGQWRIVSTCLSFGGMGPTTVMAKITQQELVGRLWTRATINKAYLSAASRVSGFVSFVNHTDVLGRNDIDQTLPNEELFVSSTAPCVGAVIGVVVCETERAAHEAAHHVQIEYELLTPTILTIEDAIQHESYLGSEYRLRCGDTKKALDEAEHTLEGTLLIGGQEHFYLETHCCLAIPSNDDQELTLYAATQNAGKIQELAALVLGRDESHITCHVKRVGGGFGGKGSRS
ncbi:unnamed protein product [Rotaria sp. Silwood2]